MYIQGGIQKQNKQVFGYFQLFLQKRSSSILFAKLRNFTALVEANNTNTILNDKWGQVTNH